MQMLYNSDSFVVVQFSVPEDVAQPPTEGVAVDVSAVPAMTGGRGGYEIVDKLARKEIYLQGAVAQSFQRGVQALAAQAPDEAVIDAFIAGFTVLAQQPLLLH